MCLLFANTMFAEGQHGRRAELLRAPSSINRPKTTATVAGQRLKCGTAPKDAFDMGRPRPCQIERPRRRTAGIIFFVTVN
jgi:hypothetical protein